MDNRKEILYPQIQGVTVWKPTDMPEIPREVAEHALNIEPTARIVAQQFHRFGEEKHKAIDEEVAKLLAARFVREIHHPVWVVNPVLVKKKNGSWRMCSTIRASTRHVQNTLFLSCTSTRSWTPPSGARSFSFLDAYSGYHQIAMKETDQHATTFITPFGMFCYVSMPFGLKNTRATYQCCML